MMVQLTAADGHKLDCWMVKAESPPRGGIVILQEIFGVTDQLKGVANAYAAKGYDVAIPALFDRKEKRAVIPFSEGPRGRDLMLASKLDQTMLDVDAAVKALAARGLKVGVIGFCWGGGLALRAAQKLEINAAVAYYGTRLPQYLDSPLKAPLLAHFGRTDDHIPPEMIAEAKAYLPEMEVYLYEAGHAFANDARPSFVAEANAKAGARTDDFLAKHVGWSG